MRLIGGLLLLLVVSSIMPLVLANERTVKTIEMPIGFAAATAANTVYIKQVNITMPDGYSKGLSFIIELTGDYPSVSTGILAKVRNNKTGALYDCNPATVTTAAATNIRNYKATFDCTSVLTSIDYGGGVMDLGFSTNKVSNNIFGVMKLTYYNDPPGSMSLSGTEYSPGDPATMFVQLKDNYGNAVSNGSCYLDIWYPLNGSGVHPYTIIDAPMIKAPGDDGIYYYDMTAPSTLGVYMLSAKCSYIFNWVWIYPPEEQVYSPTASRVTGTWDGATLALNDKGDDVYERCDSTAAILCQSNYTFNMSQYGLITNVTALNLYFAGQGDVAGKTVTFAYWNGTAFVNLPNILTVVATGATGTLPGDVDQFVTNSVPVSAIINNMVVIRYTGQMGLARLYNNWLSVAALSSIGTIQDVKGSSEMHIMNLANATANTINMTNIANAVWNATERTVENNQNWIGGTEYSITEDEGKVVVRMTDNSGDPVTGGSCKMTVFFNNSILINQTSMTEYVGTPVGVYYVVFNLTHIPGVYPYTVDCLKSGKNYYALSTYHIFDNHPENIAAVVWNYTVRNLTYYPAQVDMTNYTLGALYVWNSTTRYLTYQYDTTNYTLVQQVVWNATNRNLTYYPSATVDYASIWNYASRNLTYTPDMTNYTQIQTQTNSTVYTLLLKFFDTIIGVSSG